MTIWCGADPTAEQVAQLAVQIGDDSPPLNLQALELLLNAQPDAIVRLRSFDGAWYDVPRSAIERLLAMVTAHRVIRPEPKAEGAS